MVQETFFPQRTMCARPRTRQNICGAYRPGAAPPARCGTAEAKPERKARWTAAVAYALRGIGRHTLSTAAAKSRPRRPRALRDGGGEAGARGALDGCGGTARARSQAPPLPTAVGVASAAWSPASRASLPARRGTAEARAHAKAMRIAARITNSRRCEATVMCVRRVGATEDPCRDREWRAWLG